MRDLSLTVLSSKELYEIHVATMEILENVGVCVQHEEARQLLKKAGAKVGKDSEVIRIPSHLVQKALNECSPIVELYGRDGHSPLRVGTKEVYFGTQGYPVAMLDWKDNKYRKATVKDLVEMVRIADTLENVDFVAPPCCPSDVPSQKVDRYQWKISLMNTKKHVNGQAYGQKGVHDAVAIAEKIAGSREELQKRPFISFNICIESPLRHGGENTEVIIEGARLGIPLLLTSGPMCGANAPATLAGTLVCANAEILSGILIAKLVNPAIPVIYGNMSRIFDMKFANISSASPEFCLLRLGTAQLAQFYRLPSGGGGVVSDSKTLDEQAGYEKVMTGLSAALQRTNIIYGMGLLEEGGIMSAEALVIDNEIVGYIRRFLDGINTDENRIDIDVFRSVGVGTGKNFLGEAHTLKYFKKELWIPELSDRQGFAKWSQDGERSIRTRARKVLEEALEKPILPRNIPEGFEHECDKIIGG